MRRTLVLLGLFALFGPGPAFGQDRSFKRDLEMMGRDAWFIVSSPAHASADDWETVGVLAGGMGVMLLVDGPVWEWLDSHPNSVVHKALAPFREGSPVSLFGRTRQFLVPMSLGLLGSGMLFDNDDLRDAGLGCITSNVTTTLSRSAISQLVGRLRPHNDRGPFVIELFAFGDWEMRSFPGGHASNIMSCASFFNNRFDLGIAEPAIYALAAGVGTARIVDGAHWPSDTYFGMAYGYAVGKGIAGRFLQRERERAAERLTQPGLVLGARIRF